MDLPVWQRLYDELKDKNFVVIAVALDTGGAQAAGEWIRKAEPTYPCLIDERHVVAELYDIVNVPMGVWIDESGRIVRPAEPSGASDAFRRMDPKTLRLPDDAVEDIRTRRRVYLDALRDWAEKGASSAHAFAPEEARRRMTGPTEEDALAAANFRLAEHLHRQGRTADALPYFEEAMRLRPESWAYKRQGWALETPGGSGGPKFWAAVQALGDRPYYPAVEMEGMPG